MSKESKLHELLLKAATNKQPRNSPPLRRRVVNSIADKQKIAEEARDDIKPHAKNCEWHDATKRKRRRTISTKNILRQFEKDIVVWVQSQGEQPSWFEIRKYALELINPILPNFMASSAWLRKFRKRNSYKQIKNISHVCTPVTSHQGEETSSTNVEEELNNQETIKISAKEVMAIPSEFDQIILDWAQKQGMLLSSSDIRKYAFELINPILPDFQASSGWLRHFLDRNSFKLFRST